MIHSSDEFYERDVAALLGGLSKASPPQVVLVGATKTAAVERFLSKRFLQLDSESLGSSANSATNNNDSPQRHMPKWLR